MTTIPLDQLMDKICETCRFQPFQETKAALFELLVEAYELGESAYVVAHQICDLLGVSRKEFSHPLEILLRPEFERQ